MDKQLHTEELATCPGTGTHLTHHFGGFCEDCDVHVVSLLPSHRVGTALAGMGGGVSGVRDVHYEAYQLADALLRGYETTGDLSDPDLTRIARKLCRAKGLEIPAALLGDGGAP